MEEHRLAERDGEARRELDVNVGRNRLVRGDQGERLAGRLVAVAHGDEHVVLARLGGPRRPGQLAGRAVELGSGGQVAGRVAERRARVGVAARGHELEGLADEGDVAAQLGQLGRAVDVEDLDGHGVGIGQPARVGDGEGDGVGAGVVVAGRPDEELGLDVEARAVGHGARHRVGQRIPVEVATGDGELDRDALLPELVGQRHEHGRGVHVVHHEIHVRAARQVAIGGREAHRVGALLEAVRRPGEGAGLAVECGAIGEAGGKETHRVAVGVGRFEGQRQGVALGDGLDADREQERGRVVGSHHDVEGLGVGEDTACAAVAAVVDRDGEGVGARVGHSRRPSELGLAVDSRELNLCPTGQAGGREGQRVLVGIVDADGEGDLVVDAGHLVADVLEDGRRVGSIGRQDERHVAAQHIVGVAAAGILGEDGDGVVAAVGEHGRRVDGAGAVAVVDEGGEGRQAEGREGQSLAVGVGRGDR